MKYGSKKNERATTYRTRQGIFNVVYRHLLKQNEKSMVVHGDMLTGAYRGIDGTKCAVGALMTDERYSQRYEGHGLFSSDVARVRQILNAARVRPDDKRFLAELQNIHDKINPELWPAKLIAFGASHRLKIPTVNHG